jgi:hypothetical protein
MLSKKKNYKKKAGPMTQKQVAKRTGQRQYREYKRTTRMVELPQRPKRIRKQRFGGGGVKAEILRHDMIEEKEMKQVVRAIRSKDDGLRSQAKLSGNRTWITRAPDHETYGQGDRWHIHVAQIPIGRSGTSPWNVENRILKTAFGTTLGYAQCMDFGTIFGYSYSDGTNGTLCSTPYSSVYATDPMSVVGGRLHAPSVNLVTTNVKFYQAWAFRSAHVRYIPSVSKMVAGTLAFAPKFNDFTGANIDETNFNDIASLSRAVTTAVCDPITFPLFPGGRLNEPAINLNLDPGTAKTPERRWLLYAACDSPLTTATTDLLGHLEVEVIVDCYGRSWLADDTKGAEFTREERKIADIMKKLRDYDIKELADSKEAKSKSLELKALGEHKDLDDDDWQKIQQADSRQKICDLKAYRESLKMAQNTCMQPSSTSSTSSAVAPNVQSRTPKI